MLRLAGLVLWTSADRFSALRDFYVGLLGLQPHTERENHINFDWQGTRLTIGVHEDVTGTNPQPLRIMINLESSDIAGDHDRLTSSGVRCLRPPSDEPWGGRVATYLDPDENVIQLLELPNST